MCEREQIQIRGAGSAGLYKLGTVALTAPALVDSLSWSMLLNVY